MGWKQRIGNNNEGGVLFVWQLNIKAAEKLITVSD